MCSSNSLLALTDTPDTLSLLINSFFTPLNNQHNKDLEKLRTVKKKEAKAQNC